MPYSPGHAAEIREKVRAGRSDWETVSVSFFLDAVGKIDRWLCSASGSHHRSFVVDVWGYPAKTQEDAEVLAREIVELYESYGWRVEVEYEWYRQGPPMNRQRHHNPTLYFRLIPLEADEDVEPAARVRGVGGGGGVVPGSDRGVVAEGVG